MSSSTLGGTCGGCTKALLMRTVGDACVLLWLLVQRRVHLGPCLQNAIDVSCHKTELNASSSPSSDASIVKQETPPANAHRRSQERRDRMQQHSVGPICTMLAIYAARELVAARICAPLRTSRRFILRRTPGHGKCTSPLQD
ncbi:hypothetical protein PLICRDRAFT_366414 [Plicaturopsis crispa FD-325 SS-3]|uniref:Unplaced genomic scaffold PLICRscaffold_19, whole genome shotgun sequence n=1 Tax=Plicaturopsis crispa FD-325 SS-3 TaxID=944288 RepID=A0A0C9SWY8_PLICR|nr:hypothetical protein PLICRDRAFT_366414 [Plicaturopsis crispa FD-325 SS-3]